MNRLENILYFCWSSLSKTIDGEMLWFVLYYRLRADESLLEGHARPLACIEVSIPTLCTCEDFGDEAGYIECEAGSESPAASFETAWTYRCSKNERRKRRTNGLDVEDDNIIGPNDIPPMDTSVDITPRTFSWPTASGVTKDDAIRTCRRPIETSATYLQCKNYSDTNSIVQSCVDDMLVSIA